MLAQAHSWTCDRMAHQLCCLHCFAGAGPKHAESTVEPLAMCRQALKTANVDGPPADTKSCAADVICMAPNTTLLTFHACICSTQSSPLSWLLVTGTHQ